MSGLRVTLYLIAAFFFYVACFTFMALALQGEGAWWTPCFTSAVSGLCMILLAATVPGDV